MKFSHLIFTLIIAAVLTCVLHWMFTGNAILMNKTLGVASENVRREVYEQTNSFVRGNIKELQDMQIAYRTADEPGKQAIASVVLYRINGMDETTFPPTLRAFVAELRNERGF